MTAVLLSVLAVGICFGYFVGKARGIEHAGRSWLREVARVKAETEAQWLATVRRVEASWQSTAYSIHRGHVAATVHLTDLLATYRARVDELKAKLEGTAVPKERLS
jgi:hypothetical protein